MFAFCCATTLRAIRVRANQREPSHSKVLAARDTGARAAALTGLHRAAFTGGCRHRSAGPLATPARVGRHRNANVTGQCEHAQTPNGLSARRCRCRNNSVLRTSSCPLARGKQREVPLAPRATISLASAAIARAGLLRRVERGTGCLSPIMAWPLAMHSPRRGLRPARHPTGQDPHATSVCPDASDARPPRPGWRHRQTAQLPTELR